MKKTNSKSNKKLIIIITITLVLCIVLAILTVVSEKQKIEKENEFWYTENKDIASIINDLGSKFISIKKSEEYGFVNDIYLNFKYSPYEDGTSYERAYVNLINQVISNEKVSIRLIDEEKDIIVCIFYQKDANSYYYTINGEKNYFKMQDSLNSLNNYEELKITELKIESEELKSFIDNQWYCKDLSDKKTIYDNYEIFYELGISLKKSGRKVFNILFDKNYDGEVIKGINPKTPLKKVKDILGDPTFSDGDRMIGYKGDDIYIFFSDNGISIYRNESYDYKDFEKLLREYINNEKNVKEFTNELTYLWSDYSEYIYNSQYVDLKYANQGVEIVLNPGDLQNIIIYNNYLDKDSIKDLIKNKNIKANFDVDLIYKTEIARLNELMQKKIKNYNLPEYIGSSNNFIESKKDNCVEFFSTNEKYPSCTLNESINSYFWYDDNIFVYSVYNKGIFYYKLESREIFEILSGKENYEFKDYNDGVLYYDNTELKLGSD